MPDVGCNRRRLQRTMTKEAMRTRNAKKTGGAERRKAGQLEALVALDAAAGDPGAAASHVT